MARRFVKGLTMFMLTLALALASAVVANGQSGEQLSAKVPFDFIVAEKTLRAGDYRVRPNSVGGVVLIRSADGSDQILRLSNATERRRDREMVAKLVFHRYGNTYFLSQVWMAGETTGREFPKTRQERSIARELKAIASYHGDTKPVYDIVVVIAAVH